MSWSVAVKYLGTKNFKLLPCLVGGVHIMIQYFYFYFFVKLHLVWVQKKYLLSDNDQQLRIQDTTSKKMEIPIFFTIPIKSVFSKFLQG